MTLRELRALARKRWGRDAKIQEFRVDVDAGMPGVKLHSHICTVDNRRDHVGQLCHSSAPTRRQARAIVAAALRAKL